MTTFQFTGIFLVFSQHPNSVIQWWHFVILDLQGPTDVMASARHVIFRPTSRMKHDYVHEEMSTVMNTCDKELPSSDGLTCFSQKVLRDLHKVNSEANAKDIFNSFGLRT